MRFSQLQRAAGPMALGAVVALLAACGGAGRGGQQTGASPTPLASGSPAAPPDSSPPRVVLQREAPAQPRPVTLLEAWNIATQAAQSAWDPIAGVASLQSVDGPGDAAAGRTPGADGKRGRWIAVALTPRQPGRQAVIRIQNGGVVSIMDQPRTTSAGLPPDSPALDSPKALVEALAARPRLAPAVDKLHGYGFIAQTTSDGRFVVEVAGEYRKVQAKVTFDAASERLVGAEVAVPSSGLFISNDGGGHWESAAIGHGFVTGVAADGLSGTGFVVNNALEAIQVWKTAERGRAWWQVGSLPPEAGTWAYGLIVVPNGPLAVSTDAGLWLSFDGAASWERARGLPAGTPQWLAPTQFGSTWGVVVSVVSGSGTGLYASQDLKTWRKLAGDVYRLSPTYGGSVVALPDGPTGSPHIITGLEVRMVSVPAGTLRVAGEFGPGGIALAESPAGVMLSRDGGATWAESVHQTATSLAIAPDFSKSQLALAGTANGRVLRSADGGQTWTDTGPVGKGVRMVTVLAFLAPTSVVAVAERGLSWQGF